MNNEQKLIDCLTRLFQIKPITYGELNHNIVFADDKEALKKLRELEKEYPELGLAKYGTGEEGISFLSLFATITRFLCGKSLGVMSEDRPMRQESLIKWAVWAEEYQNNEKFNVMGKVNQEKENNQ